VRDLTGLMEVEGFWAHFQRSTNDDDIWQCRLTDADFRDYYYLGEGSTLFDALKDAHKNLMKDKQNE